VAPVSAWSDGRLSGNVYDFVTWTSDPTCSQTTTSGSICATSNDYKRVTIVVTVNGASHPSKPAVVSGFVANPSDVPPGAPANAQQNPLSSPTTSCVNGLGQTVSCSNTVSGTPLQYFPTDCSSSGTSCGTPACAGNSLHNTIASVLGIASCAGFGKNTSLDLVLPFVFSGSPIDLAGLGHGGLIEKSAGRRFPAYE